MTDHPQTNGTGSSAAAPSQPSRGSSSSGRAEPPTGGRSIDHATIENALSSARSDLAATEAELASLQADLQEAQHQRELLEQRCEALRGAISRLEELARNFRECAGTRLDHVDRLEQELSARLANARSALEAYWATNPDARAFAAWQAWSPPPGRPVTPEILRERLNVGVAHMREAIVYFADRDPSFRKTLMTLQADYRAACGPVDRDLVQRKATQYFAGKAGEFIVQTALAPMCGRMTTDVRKDLEAGSYTKVDVVMEDLHCPIIFGRGEGRGAAAGGSAALEIKWGKDNYLEKQRDHMVTQAEGHKHYDASVTFCSRDVHSTNSENELRDALREAGSPLLAVLPEKHQLDSACWQSITTYQPLMEPA